MDILQQVGLAVFISGLLAYFFPLTQKKYGDKNFMSKINLKKIKKAYGTDLKKELEGVWFKSTFVDGLEFKIAKSMNPSYERLARNLYKPYAKQMRKGIDLPKSVTDEIQTKLIVETLLLDWKGMPGSDGESVAYSKEEAIAIMEDPELKELKAEILEFADDNTSYQLELDEEIEKN